MRKTFSAWVLSCLLAASGAAQINPDVIVGDVTGTQNSGSSNGIAAFSVGTVSCNIGTSGLSWVASTNQHPVIAQNAFRVKNDRFEQIGMSWLKHGFTALAQSLCNSCQNPGTGSILGVGCSDPYGASLNGSQSGLGPRYQVNANTGFFNYPPANPTWSGNIARRLQIAETDIDPAANAGAVYFIEAQYVTPDDAAAGNQDNNASYRAATFGGAPGAYTLTLNGSTVRQKAAIWGWAAYDPTVGVQNVDVPGEGRFIVGWKQTSLGGGQFRYNVSVHNLNSDRSARRFEIQLPLGTTASNLYFHDVPYHSGEPYAGTDWTGAITAQGVEWSTQTEAQNANANALRWGSCYSFGFDADSATIGQATLDLFKAGPVPSVSFTLCPAQPPIPVVTQNYTLNPTAPYDFVAIPLAGGSTIGPTTDDSSVTATLGFAFTYYGSTFTQLLVSSNGYLTVPGQAGGVYNNPVIPNTAAPNGVIAAYWDDLNPAQGGQIRYQTVGVAPNRRFVVHYDAVARYNSGGQLENFEIILDETTNVITMTTVTSANGGASATRGIEDLAGTGGIQFSKDTPGTAVAGTSIVFAPSIPYNFPASAVLVQSGNGLPNTNFALDIMSVPYSPIVLCADVVPGPTSLGTLGYSDLGMTPALIAIADGLGVLGPYDPSAATNECGQYNFTFYMGPLAVPTGLTLYFQGYIFSPTGPNGIFHKTNLASFTGL